MSRGAVATMLLVLAGGAGCNDDRVLDTTALERQVAARLTDTVGERPRAVACPARAEAKKGVVLRCTVIARDGQRLNARVTVVDDDGRVRLQLVPR